MPEERTLWFDEGARHGLLGKVGRGLRKWREGELNLRRLVNAGLCQLSLRWRMARVLGKPYFLMVEPTNACNLRCPLCPTGRGTLGRKTGNLSLELFRKCIAELGPYLIEVNVSLMGEPMLHPDLCEMIAIAKAAGPRVVMASNGHFFTPEAARRLIKSGLDLVYISFDAVNQETYETYRKRGDFGKVVDGVRTLIAERNALGRTNPIVELQFLVTRYSEGQIEAFRAMADELGADRRVIKAISFNVCDWDDPDTLATYERFFPRNEEHRVYRRAMPTQPLSLPGRGQGEGDSALPPSPHPLPEREGGEGDRPSSLSLPGRGQGEGGTVAPPSPSPLPEREGGEGGWQWKTPRLELCTAPWRGLTVLCDGSILPCCRDVRGRYTMGNVADGVLKVWNNQRFRAFRKNLARRRDKMPICNVCPGE